MTGESIMMFGKYRTHKLKSLPRDYLLQLYTNKSLDKYLLAYIGDNIEEIKLRGNEPPVKEVLSPKEIRSSYTGCSKIGYINKKEANFALRNIHNNAKTEKVPVRSYECEICGAWHHTSLETFK
jgi:uncharacterized protein (DUF3820 family)